MRLCRTSLRRDRALYRHCAATRRANVRIRADITPSRNREASRKGKSEGFVRARRVIGTGRRTDFGLKGLALLRFSLARARPKLTDTDLIKPAASLSPTYHPCGCSLSGR